MDRIDATPFATGFVEIFIAKTRLRFLCSMQGITLAKPVKFLLLLICKRAGKHRFAPEVIPTGSPSVEVIIRERVQRRIPCAPVMRSQQFHADSHYQAKSKEDSCRYCPQVNFQRFFHLT